MYFLLNQTEEKSGPYQINELVEMVDSGQIEADAVVEHSQKGGRTPLCLLPDFIAAQPGFKPSASPGPYKSPVPYTRAVPGRMPKEAIEKGLQESKAGSEKAAWLAWAGWVCALSALICALLQPYFYLLFSIAALAFAQDSKNKGCRNADMLLILAAATVPLGLGLAAFAVSR